MKNNTTELTFGQNEDLQIQTKKEASMNEAGMMVLKFILYISAFLSINVEINGQSMTFAENDINQTPMCVAVTGNVLTNDCDRTDDQWLKSVSFFNGPNSEHLGLISGRPFEVFSENGIPAGTMSIYLDGSYEFQPTSTFQGKLPIEYVVENASGATDLASLVIEVIPNDNPIRNDKPIAHNDTNTTEMDMDVTGNVITSNDYDLEDDALTITVGYADLNGNGIRGGLLMVGTEAMVYGKCVDGNPILAGEITLNLNGSYSFDPLADFYGKVSIIYEVTDGFSVGKANLTILVLPDTGNQVFANDDITFGKMDMLQSGNMLTNDQGPESDFQMIVGAKNNRGVSLTIDGTTENELRSSGSLIIDTDGSFTYSPKSGFKGTESIAYVVCNDAGAEAACDTATLYLTTLPFLGMGTAIGIGDGGSVAIGGGGAIGGSGRFSTTNEFMIEKINGVAEEFSLYPNPGMVADGFINLSFKSITGKTQIQIADTNGRIVRRLIVDANIRELNSLRIEVADLIEGRYHLQLVDGTIAHSETFILID